jgi:hypothetical protein
MELKLQLIPAINPVATKLQKIPLNHSCHQKSNLPTINEIKMLTTQQGTETRESRLFQVYTSP